MLEHRNPNWLARVPPKRIVNIINFVRQCEPRIESITEDVLYETVVKQIEIMKRHELRGTFLLQFDALIDPRYQALFKGLPAESFEIGGWWEIMQPLVEQSGYEWRGRFPWDWHADVGFSTGYTPEEREKLVDTYMAEFKQVFGEYPKSIGSWFIDAHTLNYMYEKYGIVASCNCKDQVGTDGYTLWGGYWNQGYYPSKQNAYMPAQTAANQIPVPIFRMLGSDPIHQYDNGLGGNRQRVVSLEPVYRHAGGDAAWCQWYFDAFVDGAAMNYGYTQVGQENSFTWDRMAKGLEIQLPLVAGLRDSNQVDVMTLAEAGQWFKQQFQVTPPTSVTVLKDYTEKELKTVWFNSRFFRANLLWEKGTMRFRDIHLFDERVASDYLERRGTSSQCLFDTLPIVDGFRWSDDRTVAGLRLKTKSGQELQGGHPSVSDSERGKLVIRWPIGADAVDRNAVDRNAIDSDGEILITLEEAVIRIEARGQLEEGWYLELSHAESVQLPFVESEGKALSGNYRGTAYQLTASQGEIKFSERGNWKLVPHAQVIELDLSRRDITRRDQ